MPIRPATRADVAKIDGLLALSVHRPYHDAEQYAAMIERRDGYENQIIHVGASSSVRLVLLPERNLIEIGWWLWDGSDEADWLGVMRAALEQAIAEQPGALGWDIGGTFDAPGETFEARSRNSRAVALRESRWLPGVRVVAVGEPSPWWRAEHSVAATLAELVRRGV